MKEPINYQPSKRREISGCWNCTHCFEDFDFYCYLTAESVPTFLGEELQFSSLHLFYVEEMGICDDWRLKLSCNKI